MTQPRELLSRLLLAFLRGGELEIGLQPAGEDPTRRLIRLTLGGLPDAPLRLAHAAAALVGLSQVFVCMTHTYPLASAAGACRSSSLTTSAIVQVCK